MSEPGLEVMATVEMVGAVLWAWAVFAETANTGMMTSIRSSLLNALFSLHEVLRCRGAASRVLHGEWVARSTVVRKTRSPKLLACRAVGQRPAGLNASLDPAGTAIDVLGGTAAARCDPAIPISFSYVLESQRRVRGPTSCRQPQRTSRTPSPMY